MNFEDAFKHYQEGKASEEEKEYVENELAKAKALSPLLDDEGINITPAPLKQADIEEIKIAKKKFKWQYIVYSITSILCVFLVIGIILAGVFGSASNYAKKNIRYSKQQCVVFAKDFVVDFLKQDTLNEKEISVEDFIVDDIDTNFKYDAKKIKRSYYVYEIELEANGFEFEVYVDTRYPNECKLHNID